MKVPFVINIINNFFDSTIPTPPYFLAIQVKKIFINDSSSLYPNRLQCKRVFLQTKNN